MMAFEDTPNKRPKLDTGFISSPSPSPMRFDAAGKADNAVVLYDPLPASKGPVSMADLLKSPPVTLTIGSEQSQTTVQAALFRGISEPLNRLLINASVGDASTINECLKHDDKDAFLQLITMCYNTVLGDGQNLGATQLATPPRAITSRKSLSSRPVAEQLRCPSCKYCMELHLVCENEQCKTEDASSLRGFFKTRLKQSQRNATKEVQSMYGLLATPKALDALDKTTGKPHSLIHFAKVSNLAGKYEVWSLQIGALRSFEDRLRKYSKLAQRGPDEILDVLRYLAATSRVGARAEGELVAADGPSIDAASLLKCLMRYVVVHVKELLDEEEFREIVAEYGIIGLELMMVLRESMVATE